MATTVKTFAATTTWVCPPGVTTIQVEAYGGGGAGGAGTGNPASGGGGAGGAYAKKATYAVVPGTTYTVTVGATKTTLTTNTQAQNKGNDSWFSSNDTDGVVAEGGLGGNPATVNSTNGAAAAGSSAASFGDGGAVFKGGDGAAGAFGTKGGAGGGGAGSGGNGGSGGVGTGVGGTGTSNNTAGTGGTGPSPGAIGGNGVAWGGGGAGGIASTATDRVGGSGANGAIVLTYTAPLIASLTDNFDDNTIHSWWSTSLATIPGDVTTQNRRVEILTGTTIMFNQLGSVEQYDFASGRAWIQVIDPGDATLVSQEAGLLFNIDASNRVWIFIGNTVIKCFKLVAGVQTQVGTNTTYNSAVHKYLSISESAGVWSFDYSTDAVTWTSLQTLAQPFSTKVGNAWIYSQHWQAEAAGSHAYFDNFNIAAFVNDCFQPTGQPTSHYQPVWISA